VQHAVSTVVLAGRVGPTGRVATSEQAVRVLICRQEQPAAGR
jgi:hypothetical protein